MSLKVTDVQEEPLVKDVPVISPRSFVWDSQGQCVRHAFVRLPHDVALQDLGDQPTIWRNIQNNPNTSLRRLDRVTVVEFDEAWVVDAIVTDSDPEAVYLTGIKKRTFRAVLGRFIPIMRMQYGGMGRVTACFASRTTSA